MINKTIISITVWQIKPYNQQNNYVLTAISRENN